MVEATCLPRDNFCLACYTGIYPLMPQDEMQKYCFESKQEYL
jgi:amidophosphoribosyltransferase